MVIDISARPKMKKPGLIDMKYSAITFGPRFKDQDPRYMERIAEMCNLSNGRRSVGEIARIVGYEVGPVGLEVIIAMLKALEELGFLTLDRGTQSTATSV